MYGQSMALRFTMVTVAVFMLIVHWQGIVPTYVFAAWLFVYTIHVTVSLLNTVLPPTRT